MAAREADLSQEILGVESARVEAAAGGLCLLHEPCGLLEARPGGVEIALHVVEISEIEGRSSLIAGVGAKPLEERTRLAVEARLGHAQRLAVGVEAAVGGVERVDVDIIVGLQRLGPALGIEIIVGDGETRFERLRARRIVGHEGLQQRHAILAAALIDGAGQKIAAFAEFSLRESAGEGQEEGYLVGRADKITVREHQARALQIAQGTRRQNRGLLLRQKRGGGTAGEGGGQYEAQCEARWLHIVSFTLYTDAKLQKKILSSHSRAKNLNTQ